MSRIESLPAEEKAREYEKLGDKKRNQTFQLFGDKYEDAIEYFQKAITNYKLTKQWQNVGEVYIKCAECELKRQQKMEAANYYLEAGNAFKKTSNQDAINAYQLAIELFVDKGMFMQAGRLHKDIAALFEAEMNTEAAIEHFAQASTYFRGEESSALAMDCDLKVALFSAQHERYDQAIEIFEKCAQDSMSSDLRRFSARDYLLRAGLCILAKPDPIGARAAVERYCAIDATFQTSMEGKLLLALVTAVNEQDVDKFVRAVQEYDQLKKLDAWKTTILLRIKKTIVPAEDEVGNFT